MSESSILAKLLGTWHIQFTNFPMWLSGEKLRPTFTYAAASSSDTLVDIVTYEQRNRIRTIRGKDRHLGGRRFRWRGDGLLCLLTSDWEVAFMSPEADWAIIRFEKSLLSPAGHDIVTRQEGISDDLEKRMLSRFRNTYPYEKIERLKT